MTAEEENNNVIDIFMNKPHITGSIKCLACKHQWIGVAAAGSAFVECPECGCHRGVWENYIRPVEGTVRFVCWCECEIFYICEAEIICVGCGVRTKIEDLGNE